MSSVNGIQISKIIQLTPILPSLAKESFGLKSHISMEAAAPI